MYAPNAKGAGHICVRDITTGIIKLPVPALQAATETIRIQADPRTATANTLHTTTGKPVVQPSRPPISYTCPPRTTHTLHRQPGARKCFVGHRALHLAIQNDDPHAA